MQWNDRVRKKKKIEWKPNLNFKFSFNGLVFVVAFATGHLFPPYRNVWRRRKRSSSIDSFWCANIMMTIFCEFHFFGTYTYVCSNALPFSATFKTVVKKQKMCLKQKVTVNWSTVANPKELCRQQRQPRKYRFCPRHHRLTLSRQKKPLKTSTANNFACGCRSTSIIIAKHQPKPVERCVVDVVISLAKTDFDNFQREIVENREKSTKK